MTYAKSQEESIGVRSEGLGCHGGSRLYLIGGDFQAGLWQDPVCVYLELSQTVSPVENGLEAGDSRGSQGMYQGLTKVKQREMYL